MDSFLNYVQLYFNHQSIMIRPTAGQGSPLKRGFIDYSNAGSMRVRDFPHLSNVLTSSDMQVSLRCVPSPLATIVASEDLQMCVT